MPCPYCGCGNARQLNLSPTKAELSRAKAIAKLLGGADVPAEDWNPAVHVLPIAESSRPEQPKPPVSPKVQIKEEVRKFNEQLQKRKGN